MLIFDITKVYSILCKSKFLIGYFLVPIQLGSYSALVCNKILSLFSEQRIPKKFQMLMNTQKSEEHTNSQQSRTQTLNSQHYGPDFCLIIFRILTIRYDKKKKGLPRIVIDF